MLIKHFIYNIVISVLFLRCTYYTQDTGTAGIYFDIFFIFWLFLLVVSFALVDGIRMIILKYTLVPLTNTLDELE